MNAEPSTPRPEQPAGASPQSPSRTERQRYISNLLVENSLAFLPMAEAYPAVTDFIAYLAEHLPQNSAGTRKRFAEYIAHRYSNAGRMNLALAQFVRLCPSDRSRREILWYETLRVMPMLRELSQEWLAKLPEVGVSRQHLLDYLAARIGERSAPKIAKEAVQGLRRFGHLKSPKLAVYQPVWTEPSREVLVYVLSRLYPAPAVVRMETFKADPLWQALLWPAAAMERLILEGERTGVVARVTKLDRYYQFALEGTGDERLDQLLDTWRGAKE